MIFLMNFVKSVFKIHKSELPNYVFWAQNWKRFTNVSRNRKRRAAGWDGHVRARKISERAKKIQKEKYDETIQKPSIESEG